MNGQTCNQHQDIVEANSEISKQLSGITTNIEWIKSNIETNYAAFNNHLATSEAFRTSVTRNQEFVKFANIAFGGTWTVMALITGWVWFLATR